MNNAQFLNVIKESFKTYLDVGTSRSTAKLKNLHGNIARDLEKKLGAGFTIQSQGFGDDKEGAIDGRYYPKKVDITIYHNDKPVAGYAIKFVMRNYSQNSNNYFENMLGETANLRANKVPYFQIFILFDKLPYYKKDNKFSKYEDITQHKLDKYLKLSNDDPASYCHTPDKTLVVLMKLKEKAPNYMFADADEYAKYYKSVIDDKDAMTYSTKISDNFGNTVILNDYENYLEKTTCLIRGSMK